MKSLLKLALLSIAFTSCASRLKVVVKVADREQVLAMAEASLKAEVLPSIIALENFRNSWDEEALLNEIFTAVEKKLEAKLRPQTKEEYKTEFGKRFNKIHTSVDSYTAEAKRQYDAGKTNDAFIAINKANLEIVSIQEFLKIYKINIAENYSIDPSDIPQGPEEKSLTTAAKTAVAGYERTRFPILGDPLTSYITKKKNADAIIWKNTFNKTVSWNFLGNSDIAIILRSNPPERELKSGDYNNNFTIKGVRMDAADATNALITGLTQTMNFIANTQGISIPMPQPTTTTDPVPVQNPLVTGLFADTMTYTSKKKRLEDAKKMLLDKIKMENIQSKSGTDLDDATKRIEDYWTNLKTELNKP